MVGITFIFSSATFENDFSLLTLCSPITFHQSVQPVCLPTQPSPAYEDVVATVSGWGTTSPGGSQSAILLEANVTTQTNTVCNSAYFGRVRDSMICAKDNGKDSCQGDSGGAKSCLSYVFNYFPPKVPS